jgi:hypothetical protein
MFWCRGPRWALIVGCVVGVVLGVPDVASAGTYVMRSCNVPTQARQTAVAPSRTMTVPLAGVLVSTLGRWRQVQRPWSSSKAARKSRSVG